jgi:hypothetical protein
MGGKMPRAQDQWRPTGAPASEFKTLKIYLSAKYNYLKIFIYLLCFLYLMRIFNVVVINSSNR